MKSPTSDGSRQPQDEKRFSSPSACLGEVYDDLRKLAERYMSRQRWDHTLQPTALVHEHSPRARPRTLLLPAIPWGSYPGGLALHSTDADHCSVFIVDLRFAASSRTADS